MAPQRKRRRDNLPAHLAALPASELEPHGETVLQRATGGFRRRTYFWFVRSDWARRGVGLPQASRPLFCRTNRHVYPNCAKPVAKGHVSPHLGKADGPGSKRRCGHLGARNRRACCRRDCGSKNCDAEKRRGTPDFLAKAWSVSEPARNSKRHETCSLSRASI